MVEKAGWPVIAARRPHGLERRFLASGAAVALIDAREALVEGLAAARALADAVQANGAAMLVLLTRRDASVIAATFEAGATHYLAGPVSEGELLQALRFATRHAERLAGGEQGFRRRAALVAEEAKLWRWSPSLPHRVALSAALAGAIGHPTEPETVARGALLPALGRGGLRAALQAIERVLARGGVASFAHNAPDGRRVAHHLMAEGGAIIGHVEPVDQGFGVENAPRDPLTGLEDMRGARRWLEGRLGHRADLDPPLVLILIGLSRFDMVNAAFGRAVGDTIIRAVGRRIERLAVPGHGRRRLVARLAGAEFAVGLPGPTSLEEAELLATELVGAIARPFVAGDHVVTLAARVGIAPARAGARDAGDLLRQASLALADAREGETARVRVFTHGEESRRAEDRRLELDLRLALDEDRIEILWQPQVSIATGRIVGVEALARWRHPLLGELGAEALFAAAERSDYLVELSTHVQEKALATAAGWTGPLGRLHVAINVAAADIAEPNFADALLARITTAGLARERMTVEVTESELMTDLGAAAALLARLRASGVRVAIDDFGTGYSSLAYLKALPLDEIKIDRRLAQDIAGSARDRIVVRSVIDMARSLGLAVVAEGVETEEQLTLLAQEGCTFFQGFLCAPPLDVPALARLIERQQTRG
ncbi:putative bifunctional diguanylate cyclase/phosphodiesterase [Sphingomonas morindae]|uniref:Bifunctional diguanylate cyclase/phosphodiesterase n=1 Tax=Sphingomonas morindae TaxID=1541170 RepID=A0ABY4X800_9SPHN|nr:bifunctional diguanylate cyclase/phosphodiesterase [Sphingomonas morindae]USI73051.1 bifunctional diguanylate cyclase/phosphodiesterase [Sphingomonas morindae]